MIYGGSDELAKTDIKFLLGWVLEYGRLTILENLKDQKNLINQKYVGRYRLECIYREDLKKLPIL